VIVFVGFQAEHTLGRKLVEGWDVVPIFGVPTPSAELRSSSSMAYPPMPTVMIY
jgi:predicted metal-dependent RNase